MWIIKTYRGKQFEKGGGGKGEGEEAEKHETKYIKQEHNQLKNQSPKQDFENEMGAAEMAQWAGEVAAQA